MFNPLSGIFCWKTNIDGIWMRKSSPGPSSRWCTQRLLYFCGTIGNSTQVCYLEKKISCLFTFNPKSKLFLSIFRLGELTLNKMWSYIQPTMDAMSFMADLCVTIDKCNARGKYIIFTIFFWHYYPEIKGY